jgi:hypothetical protein
MEYQTVSKHMTPDGIMGTRQNVQSVISINIVSYLARAESRGSQGGHDDHGDNNLDGGRGGGHLGYFVVAMVPVPLPISYSCLIKYSVDRSTGSEILAG